MNDLAPELGYESTRVKHAPNDEIETHSQQTYGNRSGLCAFSGCPLAEHRARPSLPHRCSRGLFCRPQAALKVAVCLKLRDLEADSCR